MSRHWLNGQRLKVYSWAFLMTYVAVTVCLCFKFNHGTDPHGNPLGGDFIAFYGASRLALAGDPAAAYDPQRILQAEQAAIPWTDFNMWESWQYPPTFYMMVWPLALLPYFASLIAFLALTLTAWLAAIRRILPQAGALLPALAFPGVFINAGSGQNGFLTAALISTALLLLDTYPAFAGVLIGMLTIKPQLGLLLPLALLCGRRWRVFGYAALASAAFLLLSVAAFGTDTLQAFIGRMPVIASWVASGNLPLKKMPTFFALVRLLGVPAGVAAAVQGCFALFAAAGVAWVWLRCGEVALRAAALLVGTLLVSPYLYDYDLAWLGPALAWYVCHALRTGWRPLERELLVAIWLLPGVVLLLYHLLHLQAAAVLLLAFFVAILRRVREEVSQEMAMKNSVELSAMPNSAARSTMPERAAQTMNGTSTGRM